MCFRILMTASAILLAACSASPEPAATDEPVARVDAAEPAPRSGGIEVAPIPETPRAVVRPPADELVCRYERRTGSHRVERVCRTQSDIDQDGIAAKKTFGELARSQREYQH